MFCIRILKRDFKEKIIENKIYNIVTQKSTKTKKVNN